MSYDTVLYLVIICTMVASLVLVSWGMIEGRDNIKAGEKKIILGVTLFGLLICVACLVI